MPDAMADPIKTANDVENVRPAVVDKPTHQRLAEGGKYTYNIQMLEFSIRKR